MPKNRSRRRATYSSFDKRERDREKYTTLGTCEAHSKKVYATRAVARRFASAQRSSHHLSPYECETTGLWHVGGLPQSTMHGLKTRDEVYGR